jgi:hypothetical protein
MPGFPAARGLRLGHTHTALALLVDGRYGWRSSDKGCGARRAKLLFHSRRLLPLRQGYTIFRHRRSTRRIRLLRLVLVVRTPPARTRHTRQASSRYSFGSNNYFQQQRQPAEYYHQRSFSSNAPSYTSRHQQPPYGTPHGRRRRRRRRTTLSHATHQRSLT